ncbi:MAG: HepT-like ribonuclease domain-containing protein [Chitinophagaceae bacterium]
MKPEAKKFIIDIFQSIELLESYHLKFHSFKEFEKDFLAKDAVERRLAIIGEALNKAYEIDNSIHITNLRRIISLRNILVHDYDLIDSPIIWKILENDLPVLKKEIEELLK